MSVPGGVNQSVVSVAMLGARMHFAVPLILAEAGLLHTFYTDFYLGNKKWLTRLADGAGVRPKDGLLKQASRRNASIPLTRVVSFDLLGLEYGLRRRRRLTPSSAARLFAHVNHKFCKRVVRKGLDDAEVIFGFNGASLEIFEHARSRGIKCILEQTMAPRKTELKLIAEEHGRWRGWTAESPSLDDDPLVEREADEWKLADRVICGSNFVKTALNREGVAEDKSTVVPYGVDIDYFKPRRPKRSSKAINLLFMGEIGLRKGVPYLLEALRGLNRPKTFSAKLAGPIAIDETQLRKYSNWCEVTGPMPKRQACALYDWADVLVLPSLCEGSATVTYEAMASGVPVITTENSGAIVRDGFDGCVVPIRDSAALAEKIAVLCEDVNRRTQMSEAALERRGEISLAAYADRLLRALSFASN